jgi:plastocyanin
MRGAAARLGSAACLMVLFASSTTALAAPLAATREVTIQGFAFAPAEITLDKGDTIRWTNMDSASHSAVSIQPGFVTLTLVQGQSTMTIFDQPGTYEYVCGIHGVSMKGSVVVRGVPAAATARSSTVPGHVVLDAFDQARPDRVPAESSTSAFLYASVALALVALARLMWVLRHW